MPLDADHSLAQDSRIPHAPLRSILDRRLIFVSGKGGVGKTVISRGIAEYLAKSGKKTLWVSIEDPTRSLGEKRQESSHLWTLNAEAFSSFEEYVGMKLGAARLTALFLQNKVVRYLAQAAPGIRELVILGKIWHERQNFDHVVCDMPATGHGLAMFHSVSNFSRLFQGGPIHKDAEAMLSTFRSSQETGFVTLALPEEMPLVEALELAGFLKELFPENLPAFAVNRSFPKLKTLPKEGEDPNEWSTPLPRSLKDYAEKRSALEKYNLRTWESRGISFSEIPFFSAEKKSLLQKISSHLKKEIHS